MSDNVDIENLAQFEKFSDQWWDTLGPFKTLHHINPKRLEFILKHTTLLGKKTLDLGCGGGILSEALAQAGAFVKGIDLEPHTIEVARAHAVQSNLSIIYEVISSEALCEKEAGQYDVIVCMELLEHLPDPQKLIQSCAVLLKPGGTLCVSTIHRTLKSYLFVILGAEYLLNLIPKHTHIYNQFIQPSELAAWLRKANLTLLALTGMKYNPLLKDASFTSSLDVNYLAACKKACVE